MGELHLIVVDDGGGRFGPMADLRAAFEFRTGACLTLQRIERVLGKRAVALRVPEHLRGVVAERHPGVAVNALPHDGERRRYLIVNGRWSRPQHVERVYTLAPNTALVQGDGTMIAAHVDAATAARVLAGDASLPASVQPQALPGRLLIDRPWHVLDELEPTLMSDLQASALPLFPRQRENTGVIGSHPIHVADGATIMPMNVFDTTRGPIVVERGATVGSMAVLEGPCYVGADSTIAHHSSIRPNTVVGPVCKVSGEVSFSIIHGQTNKAHHGYLGHAIVGQWVNLGAATNVSNLKNTMGSVRVQLEPEGPAEDSGRTFLGPLIGDYVRTAISTRVNTGSVFATGAMVACSGYTPKHNRRFTFHTDRGVEPYDIDRFIATARAVMARRHAALSEAQETLLRTLARG